MGRMRGTHERPAGLTYQPELVSRDEERSLLTALAAYDFHEVRMHGRIARRTVRHFGIDYDYGSFQLTEAEALPVELHEVRERCARAARSAWQHSIPPVPELRYSITFRQLRAS